MSLRENPLWERLSREWESSFGNAAEALPLVERYYELLRQENDRQNLTRLLDPSDFILKNLFDFVGAFSKGELSRGSFLDLGSGGGVPGVLGAIACPTSEWILVEAEKAKAVFLENACKSLGLENVRVFGGRMEAFEGPLPETVTVRAVGHVWKIFAWLSELSGWKEVLLMKGPSWREEWDRWSSKLRGKLAIVDEAPYSLPDGAGERVLVRLKRVPRGT